MQYCVSALDRYGRMIEYGDRVAYDGEYEGLICFGIAFNFSLCVNDGSVDVDVTPRETDPERARVAGWCRVIKSHDLEVTASCLLARKARRGVEDAKETGHLRTDRTADDAQ